MRGTAKFVSDIPTAYGNIITIFFDTHELMGSATIGASLKAVEVSKTSSSNLKKLIETAQIMRDNAHQGAETRSRLLELPTVLAASTLATQQVMERKKGGFLRGETLYKEAKPGQEWQLVTLPEDVPKTIAEVTGQRFLKSKNQAMRDIAQGHFEITHALSTAGNPEALLGVTSLDPEQRKAIAVINIVTRTTYSKDLMNNKNMQAVIQSQGEQLVINLRMHLVACRNRLREQYGADGTPLMNKPAYVEAIGPLNAFSAELDACVSIKHEKTVYSPKELIEVYFKMLALADDEKELQNLAGCGEEMAVALSKEAARKVQTEGNQDKCGVYSNNNGQLVSDVEHAETLNLISAAQSGATIQAINDSKMAAKAATTQVPVVVGAKMPVLPWGFTRALGSRVEAALAALAAHQQKGGLQTPHSSARTARALPVPPTRNSPR